MSFISARRYRKLQDSLFFVTALLLPFQIIPQPVYLQQHFPLLAFPHAAAYPAGLGLMLHLLTAVNRRKRPGGISITAYFFLLTGWVVFTAICGVFKASYYQLLPGMGVGKVVFQAVKLGIGPFVVANGIAYWVYSQYRLKWCRGLRIVRHGLVFSFCIAGAYSIVEVEYLAGIGWARQILVTINPFIYTANVHHGWWPPLLWPGQVRSVAPEPSFFGIYAGVVLPFLASYLYGTKSYKRLGIAAMLGWLGFLIFMSKARTPIMLCLGEAFVLFVTMIYIKKTLMIKQILFAVVFLVMASVAASHFAVDASAKSDFSSSSVARIIMSLTSIQERSNSSRFEVISTEWKMFLNNPALGVGPGLSGSYYNTAEYNKKYVEEVQTWINEKESTGITVPVANAYTRKLAEWGGSGFVLFITPVVGIIYVTFRFLRRHTDDNLVIAYLVAFIGGCAGLLSASEIAIPSFPILLGLGFCLLERYVRFPQLLVTANSNKEKTTIR